MGMSSYVSPMLFLLEWACLLPLLFLIFLLLVQFYCYVCRAEIFDGLRRIVPKSCDCGNLCWAHPLFFPHYHHGLVTSLPIPSHLCCNPLQGSQSNQAKANILAATISDIMAKAQEASQALPDNLKKVSACLCLFYTFT